MKPDWSTAPVWAKWRTMDGDGWWQWHEFKPTYSQATGMWRSLGMRVLVDRETQADETLEARPEGA